MTSSSTASTPRSKSCLKTSREERLEDGAEVGDGGHQDHEGNEEPGDADGVAAALHGRLGRQRRGRRNESLARRGAPALLLVRGNLVGAVPHRIGPPGNVVPSE